MFVYVQSLGIVMLEILCCRMFFETFAIKRNENSRWKGNAVMAALTVSVFLSAVLLHHQFLIKQLVVMALTAGLMRVYLKIDLLKALIFSALFQGLLIVVDSLAWLIDTSFFYHSGSAGEIYAIQGSLVIVLSKVFLFCIVLLIRKYMGKDVLIKLTDTEWMKFIIFPIFTICVISAMIKETKGMGTGRQEELYTAIALGLAGVNVAVFYLICDIIKREAKVYEAKIYKLEVENQVRIYRSISENFNEQRKKAHEYNNQIMCINSLLKKKNYDILEQYMDKIDGQIRKELDCICTNHAIVDAVLNTKFSETKEKGIVLALKINDLSHLRISDEDIVVILSNLLNNAIEACDKCKGKKVIKLKFVMEEDDIILSVKNTYEGSVVYENGEIQTTKGDSDRHGIGIKNIIETIEKYKGRYVIENDGHEFYFSVMIPAEEK